MMGPGFADGIGRAFALFFVVAMVAVAVLTSLAWIVLPRLWEWLKPILHSLTA